MNKVSIETVPVGKTFSEMSPEERRSVAARLLCRYEAGHRFWQPAIEMGRLCYRYVKGQVLSDEEIAQFESDDKVVVQVSVLKPKIDSIIGTAANSMKDGIVLANGAEDADKTAAAMVVLKAIERDSMLKAEELAALQDSAVTSVPAWFFLENVDGDDPDEPGLSVTRQSWDSVLPDPAWRDPRLRDLRWIIRQRRMTLDEIESKYPDSDIRQRILENKEVLSDSITATAGEVESYKSAVSRSREMYDATGMVLVLEMIEMVRLKVMIVRNQFTGDTEIMPAFWDDQEKQLFIQQHPDFEVTESYERVCWVTTTSGTGELLDSGSHWFQGGKFPCWPVCPGQMDGKFIGVVEPVMDMQKAYVYAETEYTHSIRTLNNNLWTIISGSVANIEDFRRQRSAAGGTVVIEEGYTRDSVGPIENRREQTAFIDWKSSCSETISSLTVDRNMEGGTQSSQESSKAIDARITQNIARLSPVFLNFHNARMYGRRLLMKAIPYAVPLGKVYRLVDERNEVKSVMAGQPSEFDSVAAQMYLDINGVDYDYMETEADNSVNGVENERRLFEQFMSSYGNAPPEVFRHAAKSYPSRSVQMLAKEIEEAQKNAPPPDPLDKVKLTASLDVNNIRGNSVALEIATNLGLLKKEEEVPQQQGMESPIEQMQEGGVEDPNIDSDAIPQEVM